MRIPAAVTICIADEMDIDLACAAMRTGQLVVMGHGSTRGERVVAQRSSTVRAQGVDNV